MSVVIPCYNEERTLRKCVEAVLSIQDENLDIDVIIVDDCSTDRSHAIALRLRKEYPRVQVIRHEQNTGKGAALRTGFNRATGAFVAVQDADLEYDPNDLKKLLVPLIQDRADVVIGSRFLSTGMHRVLYFWHYVGNKFLTFLSNIFSDLNLTDMETCYKVFRHNVLNKIEIRENRFGFEPEIIAKIAHMRVRIFETGISYYGRTYREGKKIGFKDGLRAVYCILKYNGHHAPLPVQFFLYLFVGIPAAILNLFVFLALLLHGIGLTGAALAAFFAAALLNYILCIRILFRHQARWSSFKEILIYLVMVSVVSVLDAVLTGIFVNYFLFTPGTAKLLASAAGLVPNFLARRFIVFPEPASGEWRPQASAHKLQDRTEQSVR
ncbi:MAG: bifunctional glycosyltransferase family 2/GtrA family protein [Acidobacteria bacterium]|nr:bifunctional glycosyltransferase family 2/GtrA family protein [Acidobacteriota bacterium]